MKSSSVYKDVAEIKGDHVKKITVDPAAPQNPQAGDLWVDSDAVSEVLVGNFVNSDGIGRATFANIAPSSPTTGDIWIDADQNSGTPPGVYVESNGIGSASYDTVAPTNPTPGDIWLDANANSDTMSAPPVDITNSVSGYNLTKGLSAFINYTNQATVPLNILCEEGLYQIQIIGSVLQPVVNNLLSFFKPFGSDFVNQFSCDSGQGSHTESNFPIAIGSIVSATIIISTVTRSKTLQAQGISRQDLTSISKFTSFGVWNDNSTLWTHLGSVIFPFTQSGTILVTRLL